MRLSRNLFLTIRNSNHCTIFITIVLGEVEYLLLIATVKLKKHGSNEDFVIGLLNSCIPDFLECLSQDLILK